MSALAIPMPVNESGTSAREGYMHDAVAGMADIKLGEWLTYHLGATSKSKKKKNKKKGAGGGGTEPGETTNANGDHEEPNVEDENEDADEEEHSVRDTLRYDSWHEEWWVNADTFPETRRTIARFGR